MGDRRGEVWFGTCAAQLFAVLSAVARLSTGSAPFASEEAVVLALTTRDHDAGIALPDDSWVRGDSRRDAYVSPWYVTTMKHRDLADLQGELDADPVSEAVRELHDYVPLAVSD